MKVKYCNYVFLACLLAGCTTGRPVCENPEIDMPCEWHHSTSSNFDPTPADDLIWWKNLEDPTLNELMNDATTQNLDLQIAAIQDSEARFSDETQENLREVWITVSADIAKNYVELRSLQLRLEVMRQILAAQKEAMQLTQDLLARGLINTSEYSKTHAEWSSLQGELPAIDLSIVRAIHRTSTLLGYNPGELSTCLSQKATLPQVPCVLPIGIPKDLLNKRPDIRKAERELIAARGSKRAQAAFYNYQKIVLVALEEAENAIASLSYEQERLRHLTEAYRHSQKQLASAKELHQTGVVDSFALIKIKIALLQKEDLRIQSHVQLLLNYISLYKALGGGWNYDSCL